MAHHPPESEDMTLKAFLIQNLRRISYKWHQRSQAVKSARVDRGKYKCAKCGKICGTGEFAVDHINPVVDPVEGFTTWDNYIARMFVKAEQYQILCKRPCHSDKTREEKEIRRKSKNHVKKDDIKFKKIKK